MNEETIIVQTSHAVGAAEVGIGFGTASVARME